MTFVIGTDRRIIAAIHSEVNINGHVRTILTAKPAEVVAAGLLD